MIMGMRTRVVNEAREVREAEGTVSLVRLDDKRVACRREGMQRRGALARTRTRLGGMRTQKRSVLGAMWPRELLESEAGVLVGTRPQLFMRDREASGI